MKYFFCVFLFFSTIYLKAQIPIDVKIQRVSDLELSTPFGGDSIIITTYEANCDICAFYYFKDTWEMKINGSDWIAFDNSVHVTECGFIDDSTIPILVSDSVYNYDTSLVVEYLDLFGFLWENPEFVEVLKNNSAEGRIRKVYELYDNPYKDSIKMYSNVISFNIPKLKDGDYFIFTKLLEFKEEIPILGRAYTAYPPLPNYENLKSIEAIFLNEPNSTLSWILHFYKIRAAKNYVPFECEKLSAYDIDLVKAIRSRYCE